MSLIVSILAGLLGSLFGRPRAQAPQWAELIGGRADADVMNPASRRCRRRRRVVGLVAGPKTATRSAP